MYEAPGRFRRTEAERTDQHLAWDRPDQAFFAAGACHILAWTLIARHPDAGFGIVALRRPGDDYASHVIASNGSWAFDYAGWTPEVDLMQVIKEFERCDFDRLIVESDLDTFCALHRHRLPADFAHDPWPRAQAYLTDVGGDSLPG